MKNRTRTRSRTLRTIAITLASVATVCGLMAYLTIQDGPLTLPLHLQQGTDFSITLYNEGEEGKGLDLPQQLVTPDSPATMSPVIRNDGDYPIYVFIELISTADPGMLEISASSNDWYKLDTSYTEGRDVYAYGARSQMMKVEPNGDLTSNLPVEICLPSDVKIEEPDQTIQAVAFAIDATGIVNPDSKEVWKLIESGGEE